MKLWAVVMAVGFELFLPGMALAAAAFPIGRAIRSRCRKSPLLPCGQDRPSTTSGTPGKKTLG
jgi:hypothetical protein